MFRGVFLPVLVVMLISFTIPLCAVNIAIVDFADEWNKQACLGPLLDDLGQKYVDITTMVEKGELKVDGYNTFIIGSFVTNNAVLLNSLNNNAANIEQFLADGGSIIELTQADQNQAQIKWLPKPLEAARTDLDYAQIVILDKAHPIFNKPNKLGEAELSGWGIKSGGWSTAWETFGTHSGFNVLAAKDNAGSNPCILDSNYKNGRILLLSIAPDKKHILGTTPASTENSMKLMENILTEYSPAPVESRDKIATVWGNIKSDI